MNPLVASAVATALSDLADLESKLRSDREDVAALEKRIQGCEDRAAETKQELLDLFGLLGLTPAQADVALTLTEDAVRTYTGSGISVRSKVAEAVQAARAIG